jgi:allantoin racemase
MSIGSMRIGIVNPNTTRSMTEAVIRSASKSARPETQLVALTPARGVPSIESHVDEVWGALSVLREVERCEALEQPPDAYVIACFGDTGVPAAREAASGPVVGMTESALMTAALLAHRFTIVTMPPRTMAQSDAVIRSLGLGFRCAVRSVDVPVAEVEYGSIHLFDAFAAEGRLALADHAEALVLGCAGLADLVEPLQDALGVPVIEGVAAGVAIAEGLVAQRLSTSRTNTWARAKSPESDESS